jgi:hypothetical protein
MSQIIPLLHAYSTFQQETITDRFFKHSDLVKVLESLKSNSKFDIKEVGKSFQGRSINLIRCSDGPVKVFLWSQMHGNEPTATMALMDMLNFLGSDEHDYVKEQILQNCTLYILPMVNPDGAEVFTRRNAQEIDINRDFLAQQSPEGRLLRTLRDEIKPHFGFNLHDQVDFWSAGTTGNPATISLLAPAYDHELSVDTYRQIAMQVIAGMNTTLQAIIPGHVGRFNDEHEPRAFGDNFQAAGTSTILIESGGYANDREKQEIRTFVFAAIISGLLSISERTYIREKVDNYFAIPENKRNHFQILLRNCKLQANSSQLDSLSSTQEAQSPQLTSHTYTVDIGLIAQETVNEDLRSVSYTYMVGDVGDLSDRYGYKELDCESFKIILTRPLKLDEAADLVVLDGTEVLLTIEKGIITGQPL